MMIELLLLLAAASRPSVVAPPAIRWTACDVVVVPGTRCGLLRVPEDHARSNGKQIELWVAVLPAHERPVEPDPVLELFGGPGDFGSRRVPAIARLHEEVNAHRDVVILDQRGTGKSTSLECLYGDPDHPQTYVDAFLPNAELRRCRERLTGTRDLTKYRTVDFARDIEALRIALGVQRFNLYGTSYGSRAALHYAARYPDAVRSLTLVGVAPPQLVIPTSFAADADRALGMILSECAASQACRAAFPSIRVELDSVMRRLERAPTRAVVVDPGTGRASQVTLSRAVFGEAVRAMLYNPFSARRLPLFIHRAFGGNYSDIATAAFLRHRGFAADGSLGLYLAVTCIEDIPRVDTAAARAQARGTVLGDSRLTQHLDACAGWPGRSSNDEAPPLSAIRAPMLLMVGDADPVTPPRWARLVSDAVPRSRVVVVPGGGHGFAGMENADCLARITAAFVARPASRALDTSCVATIRPPPFSLP
jgi:pimeloyl-ACP methyl ester carboxylesterase